MVNNRTSTSSTTNYSGHHELTPGQKPVLMITPHLHQHPRASEVNRCCGIKTNGLKTSLHKAWSGVTKPRFDLGRAPEDTAQPTSRVWEFYKSVFWRGNGQCMNTAGGQQVRNLSLQYPPSECQETLPKEAPAVQTITGWEEALLNSSPSATIGTSTWAQQWWSSTHTLPASSPGTSLCCHAAGLPATHRESCPSPPCRPGFTSHSLCSLVQSCGPTGKD